MIYYLPASLWADLPGTVVEGLSAGRWAGPPA